MRNPFAAWLRNADKTLAKVNFFAILLASDQLLYAPSLALFLGKSGWLAWPVALIAPAFAVTPWIARRSSVTARIWLPLIGIVNTAVAQLALGVDSGVWVFLLPSVALAGMLLHQRERWALVLLTMLAMAVFLFLPKGHDVLPTDIALAATHLNTGSAIILTGFIGWIFARRTES